MMRLPMWMHGDAAAQTVEESPVVECLDERSTGRNLACV